MDAALEGRSTLDQREWCWDCEQLLDQYGRDMQHVYFSQLDQMIQNTGLFAVLADDCDYWRENWLVYLWGAVEASSFFAWSAGNSFLHRCCAKARASIVVLAVCNFIEANVHRLR